MTDFRRRLPSNASVTCHHLRTTRQDEYGCLDILSLLATPTDGTTALLNAVDAANRHWPTGPLHTERFTPVAQSPTGGDDSNFEVEFAPSGVTLTVPADRSIIDVTDEAGCPSSTPAKKAHVACARPSCYSVNPTTETPS